MFVGPEPSHDFRPLCLVNARGQVAGALVDFRYHQYNDMTFWQFRQEGFFARDKENLENEKKFAGMVKKAHGPEPLGAI